jgi:hypothetical protein
MPTAEPTPEAKHAAQTETAANAQTLCQGTLHIHVAFDWGDGIDLGRAKQLVPSRAHRMPRRPRTPSSIEYRPLPLYLGLPATPLDLPGIGPVAAGGELTIFDFAAVSVAWRLPFRLSTASLTALANYLATAPLVEKARQAIEPVYTQLLPAIDNASWGDLFEEYYVIQFSPEDQPLAAQFPIGPQATWLASLVRLDSGPISPEEVGEALRLRIAYTGSDLFVADWQAAVLIDRDCEETLEVIEFANLQLLEYRQIDQRLDDNLTEAYDLVHALSHSRLPLWRTHHHSLRVLSNIKVEAADLFARTSNVLKLVGDQYLARVYRLLAERFHLTAWEASIRGNLDALEGSYKILSDQAATYRAELLEVLVIVLIAVEIGIAIFRH